MTSLMFLTPGKINLQAALTFGVSAKSNPSSAIGYFGTGLKYALAIALRSGHSVQLHTPTTSDRGSPSWDITEFYTQPLTERGKDFDLVYMKTLGQEQGQSLNFTTHIGANWAPWMAMRELESNTRDEYGKSGFDLPVPSGWSAFIISGGDGSIAEAYSNLNEYFLTPHLLERLGNLEIHSGHSKNLFYKGVNVGKIWNEGEAQFTYNLTSGLALSEDRTAPVFSAKMAIIQALGATTNPSIARHLLTHDKSSGEYTLPYSWFTPEEFLKSIAPAISLEACANDVCELVMKTIRGNRKEHLQLSVLQQSQLTKALGFLARIGHQVSAPIQFAVLPTGTLGEASSGTIFIGTEAFAQGTKCVAKTIFEEHCHIVHGVHDCNYDIQHLYLNTIMTLGEQLLGEAL